MLVTPMSSGRRTKLARATASQRKVLERLQAALNAMKLNIEHLAGSAGTFAAASAGAAAAAVARAGVTRFRGSVRGEARGPLCGMGVCFECRVTIDGQPHCRSCLTLCAAGMEVRTDE